MAIKMPHSVKAVSAEQKAEAFISGAALKPASAPTAEVASDTAVVNMRFNRALLARVDAAAKRKLIIRAGF
jgi:hypothetical protein